MTGVHVVMGGGTVGSRLARLLANQGRKVIVLSRSLPTKQSAGIEYIDADATSTDSLRSAAPEASVVYNCVNPAYNTWKRQWPLLSRAVNSYAMATGADLVICSNLYGYAPSNAILTEGLPLNATWANAVARARVWEEAKALHDAGKLRATEVRGSDYLAASDQSRMGDRVVPRLIHGKPVQLLGALDEPHTWTDPGDVASLMATLAHDDRSWGRPWHVPSNGPRTQREVVADIARELGVTDYRLSALGTGMQTIVGMFNPVVRELNQGRYMFTKPFVMSSQAATTTFGLTAKPWDQVIADLVREYRAKKL
jgi:nucleoside-diphosphate-sugar epimerase